MEKTDLIVVHEQKKPLQGKVSIQGSKNAALPIITSSILIEGVSKIRNVPNLNDIYSIKSILEYLGSEVEFEKGVLTVDNRNINNKEIKEEFTNLLRASSLFMGSLLGRFGKVKLGHPGGCVIGVRPLNFHLEGFESLGCLTDIKEGTILIDKNSDSLFNEYTLPFPSVGATENLIAFSVLGEGKIKINNAAREPEIIDQIDFLNSAGAKIAFDPGGHIIINQVPSLKSFVDFSVQSDRIEAGTIISALGIVGGTATLLGANAGHLSAPIQKARDMGMHISETRDGLFISSDGNLSPVDIQTGVYPAFPTDLQSLFAVMMLKASGRSTIEETVFEHRFRYIDELNKMNGNAIVKNNTATISNSPYISGCNVKGHDLRGSASMVIAGLIGEGVTTVSGTEHLYRGYEALIEKLTHLGAKVYHLNFSEPG